MRGRGCEVAGELTDSPASLVTFLLMLTHSFSMNSCASVDYWINVLEKEIKDMVVSKHSLHLSEVERILKGKLHNNTSTSASCSLLRLLTLVIRLHLFCTSVVRYKEFGSYLDPFEAIMQDFASQQEASAVEAPPAAETDTAGKTRATNACICVATRRQLPT